MGALSGFGGRVFVGPTDSGRLSFLAKDIGRDTDKRKILPCGRWQVTASVELINVTTAASGTCNEYLDGYEDFEVVFDCFWDTGLYVFGESHNVLHAGQNLGLLLALDRDALQTRSWFFPNILVSNVMMDNEVRGVVKYTVTGRQSGNVEATNQVSYPSNPL